MQPRAVIPERGVSVDWLNRAVIAVVAVLLFTVQSIIFDTLINIARDQPVGTFGKFLIGVFALICTIIEVVKLVTSFSSKGK
jgi:hypothetical protein